MLAEPEVGAANANRPVVIETSTDSRGSVEKSASPLTDGFAPKMPIYAA
jgi:hypothetical protein